MEDKVATGKINEAGDSSSNVNRKNLGLTVYLYILMAIYAVSITMIGPLMPLLISEFAIRTSQGGLIITVASLGGVISIVFTGIMADHLSKPKMIWFSYIFFGLSFLLVAFVNLYSALLVLFFVFGASSRITDTIINAYVSDLHKSKRSIYLNLLHTCFGIGAFAGPIYIRYLLDRDYTWQNAFSYLGILCLGIISFMFIFLPKKRSGNAISEQRQVNPIKHFAGLRKSPVILAVCLIMFFYLGHQIGAVTWIPMYFQEVLHASPAQASWALSLLWVGIILGRLICSYLSKRFKVSALLGWGSAVGFIVLAAGMLLQKPVLLITALFITGLFSGATIPLLVTLACDVHPEHSGAVSSLIFLSGTFSAMIFPWLIGLIAETAGFQTAMMLTWILLAFCAAGGLYLYRRQVG